MFPAARVAARWDNSWERNPYVRVVYDTGIECYDNEDDEDEYELILVFTPEGGDD